MDDWLVQRCGGLTEVESGEELYALHLEQGNCYGFNATAKQVWGLVDRPLRVSELCSLLASKYKVEPEVCDRDVRELLRELEQDGLIRIEV